MKSFLLLAMLFSTADASWLSIFTKSKDPTEKSDNQENSSIMLEQEDTPAAFEQPLLQFDAANSEPWQKPDYSKSIGSIGYSESTFAVPPGLEAQVNFWKKIYTKYSSWQGVLHDSEIIDNIYTEVDFTEIMQNPSLDEYQKRRAKESLVKQKKAEVRERLLKIQTVTDPSTLVGEDLRFWKMFEAVEGKNKFKDASQKGRLRFQLGQSNYFRQGIYSSGHYIRKMTEIFIEQKVPIELVRLPFVESSFNLNARSKVGASGIWQFMRSTGKSYMKVNALTDYRNDPIAATRAAAKKLRGNYEVTQSWPLAITGYNYGPSGIARLSKSLQTKDLVEIIKRGKSRRFGFASKNFYASYLAALQVEAEADKYFKNPVWMKALTFVEIKTDRPYSSQVLKEVFEKHGFSFLKYNPQFNASILNKNILIPSGLTIYLPAIEGVDFIAALQESKGVSTSVAVSDVHQHRVDTGETLSSIAQLYGISIEDIKNFNSLSDSRIYIGQKINIPQK
jgi:membrane-bound lytic murein transglycosylase D